jgi:hypothetical protein
VRAMYQYLGRPFWLARSTKPYLQCWGSWTTGGQLTNTKAHRRGGKEGGTRDNPCVHANAALDPARPWPLVPIRDPEKSLGSAKSMIYDRLRTGGLIAVLGVTITGNIHHYLCHLPREERRAQRATPVVNHARASSHNRVSALHFPLFHDSPVPGQNDTPFGGSGGFHAGLCGWR